MKINSIVGASVISYVTFVVSLFVPPLSFLSAVLCDCGNSWVTSHIKNRERERERERDKERDENTVL